MISFRYASPKTAFSFALGTFIVLVPSSAMGLLILAAVAVLFERVNRIALFSAAVIFNPLVNIAFYAASYYTGSILLGYPSMPGPEMFSLTLNISQNVIVGSVLNALVLSAVGYLVFQRIAVNLQAK